MLLDSVYYNTGNLIYLGAQWIIAVALVRLGGFEDAGIYALTSAVGTVFGSVAGYGLRSFQVSDINNRFSDYVYIFSRIITILLSVFLCVFYIFVKRYEIKIALSVFCFMAYKCAEAYSDVFSGIWQKNGNMFACGMSLGIKGTVNAVSFFAIYIASKSIVWAMLAMAISSFVVLIFYDFSTTKKYINKISFRERVDMSETLLLLKYGFITMLFVLSSALFNGIPRMIIEKKCGAEMLGVFSSAFSPTVVISTLALGILASATPKMAEKYEKKENNSIFNTVIGCNLVFIAIGILAGVLALKAGKWAFELLFGSEILQYINLLYYLIFASVLISSVCCFSSLMIAIRKLKQLLLFSTLACVLVFALSLVLIPKYSIYGAAYAMIITLIAQFAVESVYLAAVIHNNGKTDIPSKT